MGLRPILYCLLLTLVPANGVTVYYPPGQAPLSATESGTAAAASYTGAAAYNPTVLNPPPIPSPPPAMNFQIQLQKGGQPGLSIVHEGSFFGFSVEMSVANQVLGKNSTLIQVPFLNLMANLVQRGGVVRVRIGGNTQETAKMVDFLDNGRFLEKEVENTSNPTLTPPLDFTNDLFYAMHNISTLLNVRWFLGIPFFDTNFKLDIAEHGQEILGDYLLGLQAGNEPDLYARHKHRPDTYQPQDYMNEFRQLITAMNGDAHIVNRKILIGPNLASADWRPQQIWDIGFVDAFTDNLVYLAVEHYPIDNCFAQFGVGTFHDPQETFPMFLSHKGPVDLVAPYFPDTAYAQTKGKKMLMFETNTASCGGFPGISDSFGAALWGLDYGMQMAYANFSGALIHVGGQSVFYNPFTSPPTNQSTFHQWTIGPMYYAALVMSEAFGASNTSQIVDLQANTGSIYTPAYAIYENGNPVRVALFNYMTDPSGANDYTADILVGEAGVGGGSATPKEVKVKYLLASSVSQKGNFTWAGQTFGDHFASDGRLMGELNITTVPCDAATSTCKIKVPAPGFAMVFLSDDALTDSDGAASTTFSTSARTRFRNTATVDKSVLATSNGHKAAQEGLGSTSHGSGIGNSGLKVVPAIGVVVALGLGGLIAGIAMMR